MADEKGNNVAKSFNDIEFDKVEDTFMVTVEYDANSELLSLTFINQTTKDVFEHEFNKDNVHTITDKCNLQPDLVVKMIIDTLSSRELSANNVRIFLLPNIKQATAKYNELRALTRIPDAINIPSGFQPKLNQNNIENNSLDNCLLFVLHFSAPPYIYFNYCFIIKAKEISDNDKLGMRLNDVHKENKSLKDKINRLVQTVQDQQQQIDQLTQRLQQSEAKSDELKIEEIELILQNNWARHSTDWPVPKALKIGHVVYLKGLIGSGTSGHIVTLPEGWRAKKHMMFSQCSNGCATRVDVYNNGRIDQIGQWTTWISLTGISFVTQ